MGQCEGPIYDFKYVTELQRALGGGKKGTWWKRGIRQTKGIGERKRTDEGKSVGILICFNSL